MDVLSQRSEGGDRGDYDNDGFLDPCCHGEQQRGLASTLPLRVALTVLPELAAGVSGWEVPNLSELVLNMN
jgi:hypothetical protein